MLLTKENVLWHIYKKLLFIYIKEIYNKQTQMILNDIY